MNDGVDGLEGIGELKSEGMGAGLCDDVVGTKILFRELLQRISPDDGDIQRENSKDPSPVRPSIYTCKWCNIG